MSVDCFCVWSVPLSVSTSPLSDWVSCFELASTWQLLIGPHCQLATSKTVSTAVIPLTATDSHSKPSLD